MLRTDCLKYTHTHELMSAESVTSSGAAGILSGRNKECWEPEASGRCGAAVAMKEEWGPCVFVSVAHGSRGG